MIDSWRRRILGTTAWLFVFLLYSAVPSHAETYCVTSVNGLNTALFYAQTNGQDDTIKIARGTYSGTFVYSSAEAFSLSVLGGYDSTCNSRTLDADNTIIDAGQAGPCLVLTSTVAGDFEVQGITFQNGETTTNGDGGGLRIQSDEGDATVDSNSFKNNHADSEGGGALRLRS